MQNFPLWGLADPMSALGAQPHRHLDLARVEGEFSRLIDAVCPWDGAASEWARRRRLVELRDPRHGQGLGSTRTGGGDRASDLPEEWTAPISGLPCFT